MSILSSLHAVVVDVTLCYLSFYIGLLFIIDEERRRYHHIFSPLLLQPATLTFIIIINYTNDVLPTPVDGQLVQLITYKFNRESQACLGINRYRNKAR